MDRVELLETLMQADNESVRATFQDFLRGAMRYAFLEAMEEEVARLCGPKYARCAQRQCVRAGSAEGVAYFDTDCESVRRPRVRRRWDDGRSREVGLKTYAAGKDGESLRQAVLRSFVAGVSSRQMGRVMASNRRTSKSEVARTWQAKAGEYLDRLRGRDLCADAYVVLMLDGVVLSDDLTAVVALGITAQGVKRMLDFEMGASENATTCTALTDRLVQRGLRFATRRPLAVLDGSSALRKAVRKHWCEAHVQTCLVHVARNLQGKLSLRRRAELQRLFRALREASSLEAAREAYGALEGFVGRHSAEGLKSLHHARDEMLTLFRLGVPDTFNKPLLSTNSIENGILNMRRLLGRVRRWRAETDMALHWTACAMLEAERGFRRIQGYGQMQLLIDALNRDTPDGEKTEQERFRKEDAA